MQNEKRKLLMEHETLKLKELDEEYAKDIREWKAHLKPRKQVSNAVIDFKKYAVQKSIQPGKIVSGVSSLKTKRPVQYVITSFVGKSKSKDSGHLQFTMAQDGLCLLRLLFPP